LGGVREDVFHYGCRVVWHKLIPRFEISRFCPVFGGSGTEFVPEKFEENAGGVVHEEVAPGTNQIQVSRCDVVAEWRAFIADVPSSQGTRSSGWAKIRIVRAVGKHPPSRSRIAVYYGCCGIHLPL